MTCSNHPDRENVAFCQNCGKPLCQECTRVVGSAVFCEPCLAARLAGAGTPPAAGPYTAAEPNAAYTAPGAIPPPMHGEPNPGLAALLGLIPGVGAMYNGQYAKGVVHLIVFAILVSLADEHGIFGLFIAGWVCYQVIEAHHTAKARRDGTPLPNPFGLNDLGERLGFGKAWPGHASSTTPPAASAVPPAGDPYSAPPPGYTPPTASWSAPWEANFAAAPVPPYGVPLSPLEPLPSTRNRFPAGALWLIGLGCLFLIGNAGLFRTFPIHHIVPVLLIAFGVWLFVRKMTDSGAGFVDDGTPGYQFRLFRALRGSIWIILIGILFELDSLGVLSWAHSWPVILIVAGLMAVFQRISYSAAMAAPYPYPPAPPITPTSPAEPAPPAQQDQEGR
jgi:B-box zinc finger